MKASESSAVVPATLQGIAEQLTAALGRPVWVRGGPPSAPAGVCGATDPSLAAPRRLDVTVEDRGVVVAHIAVRTEGRSLGPSDFEALDAASLLVRDLLRAEGGTSRESVLHDLLHDDEGVRRSAYARAVQQRWLHRDEGTVVRALLVDAAVTDIHAIAFARHLANLRPVPHHFMALHAGMVMLVGQPSDRGIDDVILREAAARGIRVLGIGSASPAPGAEDVRAAADEAVIAASLAAALPQFHPAVDASELGGWLLLASASANPEHLRIISPAAHALYVHGDGSQRETIETYLDVGANVVAACEILFVHRTTLYYRLERMPEVVRDALSDGIKRSTLHVALKLIRLWEATGRA